MEKGAVRGAEYTKVDSDEILNLINKTIGTTQGAIDRGETVLEKDGASAPVMSFVTLTLNSLSPTFKVSSSSPTAFRLSSFTENETEITLKANPYTTSTGVATVSTTDTLFTKDNLKHELALNRIALTNLDAQIKFRTIQSSAGGGSRRIVANLGQTAIASGAVGAATAGDGGGSYTGTGTITLTKSTDFNATLANIVLKILPLSSMRVSTPLATVASETATRFLPSTVINHLGSAVVPSAARLSLS